VGHREILSALSRGVRVIGASSMGALRAAELDTLGMEGVGLVYRLYKEGTLVSDDEVALIYDPESFFPLSEPLVNIRCTLRKARESGIVTADEEKEFLASARSLYFPDRTYSLVCKRAEGETPGGDVPEIPRVFQDPRGGSEEGRRHRRTRADAGMRD